MSHNKEQHEWVYNISLLSSRCQQRPAQTNHKALSLVCTSSCFFGGGGLFCFVWSVILIEHDDINSHVLEVYLHVTGTLSVRSSLLSSVTSTYKASHQLPFHVSRTVKHHIPLILYSSNPDSGPLSPFFLFTLSLPLEASSPTPTLLPGQQSPRCLWSCPLKLESGWRTVFVEAAAHP